MIFPFTLAQKSKSSEASHAGFFRNAGLHSSLGPSQNSVVSSDGFSLPVAFTSLLKGRTACIHHHQNFTFLFSLPLNI